MPQEQQPGFKDVAEGLPDGQKAEFYKTLHEAGISPKDEELARLLRALQLYKAYYESIPAAVKEAAAKIEQFKKDIEQISADARTNLDLNAQLAGKVILETERIHQDFAQIHKHIEEAMRQSAENLASDMSKLLAAGIEEKIISPLQNCLAGLMEANKAFDDAIARNKKATASLKESTVVASRFHMWTYAIWGSFIFLAIAGGAGFYLNHWYSNRFTAEREALIKQTEQNREVLQQLSKSHRTLELVSNPQKPNRKLLVMKNASGWQTPTKHGVIEFDE